MPGLCLLRARVRRTELWRSETPQQEPAAHRFTIAAVHPRLLQFGHIGVPTSAVLTAIAVLAALFTARTTAPRFNLDPEKIWDLTIIGVLAALIAPRLLLIFANWQDFLAHPLWMLGLATIRSPTAVIGGTVIAMAVMGIFAFFINLPFRRTLDSLAPALALGYAIYYIGNFTAGASFGVPANLPWAVTYTSRLASLWNGTPLGTPLHPVQIYAAILELAIFILLVAATATPLRKSLRDGELIGIWLFLHGLTTFFLTFLRGDLTEATILQAQIPSGIMVLAGGLLWLV
jgi:phosphatidylglycerol:prolipoprotein diacylglycerol transferase